MQKFMSSTKSKYYRLNKEHKHIIEDETGHPVCVFDTKYTKLAPMLVRILNMLFYVMKSEEDKASKDKRYG